MHSIPRELSFNSNYIDECIKKIKSNPSLLLEIDQFRIDYAKARIQMQKEINDGKLPVFVHQREGSQQIIKNTVKHNLENMNPDIAPRRAIGLLGPILGMDQVIYNLYNLKILIIGPRTEAEILWYISKGFDRNKIVGLDLISYSQYIQTGDMHSLPYADSSFDIIIFSWVLGYSSQQELAVKEAVRVIRTNGLIGIGEQWDPRPIQETSKMMIKTRGYSLDGTETTSINELINLFNNCNTEVIFKTEPLEQDKSRVGLISVIVKVTK